MKKNIFLYSLSVILISCALLPYFITTGGIKPDNWSYLLKGGRAATVNAGAEAEYPTQDYIISAQKDLAIKQEKEQQRQSQLANELRGVWVPYLSLSNVNAAKIDDIVKQAKEMQLNTVILQVRPFGDALYNSKYYPWSHLVAGKQGEAPAGDFDPLAYAVKACHENGLKLHAWLNPLRIQTSSGKPELAANNAAKIWQEDDIKDNDAWVVSYKGGLYYNPAEENVRKLIANGAAEIAQNYDVDGIHFDDYFYPAQDESFDDSSYYKAYQKSGGTLSLIEWRQENIDTLVGKVYSTIKEKNEKIVFGISPSGNIENCLNAGANVKKWASTKGYVDYICPQVYWTFGNASMPFDTVCKQWSELATLPEIKLYIGLALYKTGSDLDNGTWQTSDENLKKQVLYIREECPRISGFIMYSYEYFKKEECAKEVAAYLSLN